MSFDRVFERNIARVLTHEGGYVNHPADPGGETQWGISKRSYPNVDIRALTRDGAVDIYRRDFWQAVHADQLPPAVAFQALDFAVNSGIGTALRKLQEALGVADDGHWGPVTLAAVSRANPYALTVRYIRLRLNFMRKLSTWKDFGNGWAGRIADDLGYAAEDFEGATA